MYHCLSFFLHHLIAFPNVPIINVHPSSLVEEDGSVNLRCELATNANLPILFTHNGVVIDGSDPDQRITSNNLNIRTFGARFVGEYVCLARNRVRNTTLTVASAPAFIRLKGMHSVLSTIFCWEGESCEVH